jgi:hypothetical protein
LLYEELLDIIVQTGRILKRRPDRDLRDRLRESRKRELPRDILRKNIVAVLKEMGGNGHERDVLKEIGDKLKEQFTPADRHAVRKENSMGNKYPPGAKSYD